jgi:hypothetical protein
MILNPLLESSPEIFVDDFGVNGRQSGYIEEELKVSPAARRLAMEDHQNPCNVLVGMERAGDTIAREKCDWCWNGVHITRFVCGEAEREAARVQGRQSVELAPLRELYPVPGIFRTLHILSNMDSRIWKH